MINNYYGPGTGQIWLDQVTCSGTELTVSSCSHNPWGFHDCLHVEDVSIACNNVTRTTSSTTTSPPPTVSVRLAGSSVGGEGRLEVYYHGVWGTVCDDYFDNDDAAVACSMLGLGRQGQTLGNRFGAGTGQIWLDNLMCSGIESSLAVCSHNSWGVHDCSHVEDVSISCVPVSNSTPVWTNDTCGRSKYSDAGEMFLPSPVIVGGQSARAYEFPWQVSLRRVSTRSHFCGASIINKQWIITAAHCVVSETATSMYAVVGEYQRSAASTVRQTLNIASVTIHNAYNSVTSQNDIALLRVVGNMTFNDDVAPVCPPNPSEQYTSRKAQCSGWGTQRSGALTLPDILQYTTLNLTSNQYCQSQYPDDYIYSQNICATDNRGNTVRDSCQGDSGGPLTVKDVDGTFRLVGAVSWGIGCASGYPGVYTRVSSFDDWITQNIGGAQ